MRWLLPVRSRTSISERTCGTLPRDSSLRHAYPLCLRANCCLLSRPRVHQSDDASLMSALLIVLFTYNLLCSVIASVLYRVTVPRPAM